MTKEEALNLALEALEEVKSWKSPTRWDGCFDKEITAIKEALSGCQCQECQVALHASDCAVHNEPAYPKGECNCGAHPKQEPVAWMRTSGTGSPVVTEELLVEMPDMRWNFQQPLYTTPPQRTWVGLTDEDEIPWDGVDAKSFAAAIEAKLKEKNT